jgi:hypothetical protein
LTYFVLSALNLLLFRLGTSIFIAFFLPSRLPVINEAEARRPGTEQNASRGFEYGHQPFRFDPFGQRGRRHHERTK